MIHRRLRGFLIALCAMFLGAGAQAQTVKLSAPDALVAVQSGQMILLDIRRPSEWRKTGVASVARPVSMHDRQFGPNLSKIIADNPDTQIGLICATGGRTDYVAQFLASKGIGNIVDVSEGMLGNGQAPGWIARGFPIVDLETAQQNAAQSR